MCWISEDKPIKMIADKDIPCFKVMFCKDGNLFSLYFGMDYKVGIIYGKEGEIDVERKSNIHMDDDIAVYRIEYCVNEGFHSYSHEKCCIKKEYGLFNIYTSNAKILVVSPYNSLLNKSYQYVYADCVIPKGSVYYENEGGELVSEKIKVIGYKPISDSALKLFNKDSFLNSLK